MLAISPCASPSQERGTPRCFSARTKSTGFPFSSEGESVTSMVTEWNEFFATTTIVDFFQTLGRMMEFCLSEVVNLTVMTKKTVPSVQVKGYILKYEPNIEPTSICDMAKSRQNRRSMLQYKKS